VRAPGDLRAFDRIALARPLRLSTKGLASMEVHPVDFSQGGVLLPPGDEDALGGFCTFTFSPDDSGPAPITREGQIIRSDAKGVAFRFSAPLEDDQYKMLKIMARPRGSTKSSGEC